MLSPVFPGLPLRRVQLENPVMVDEIEMTIEEQMGEEEALLERRKTHFEQIKKLASEWNEMEEAYARDITELIGKAKVRNARAKHEELLTRMRKSSELFDLSPEGRKALEAYEAQIAEERHELYRSMRFDHEGAIALRKQYLDRKMTAYDRFLDLDAGREWATPSPKGLPITDNPWSHYSAPYVNEWGTSNAWTTRGYTSATHNESRASGGINCFSYTRVVGADDSDSGATKAMSEVQVRFRMPAAGMVEIWATLQDVQTDMNGRLRDESGCSDGRVRQSSRAYLWTSGGTERYQTLATVSIRSDGSNRSWNETRTVPGQFIYPHIFSSRTYAAGELVTVAIGVQDDTSFSVNDMSVNPSRVTSRYFVKDIWVRSTGAP